MKQRFIMLFIFVFTFILLVDIYSFKGIKLVISGLDSKVIKYFIYTIYWIIPVLMILFLLYFRTLLPFEREPRIFRNFFLLAGFFILFYIPKLVFIVFHLADDIVYLGKLIIGKLFNSSNITVNNAEGISN